MDLCARKVGRSRLEYFHSLDCSLLFVLLHIASIVTSWFKNFEESSSYRRGVGFPLTFGIECFYQGLKISHLFHLMVSHTRFWEIQDRVKNYLISTVSQNLLDHVAIFHSYPLDALGLDALMYEYIILPYNNTEVLV